MKELEMILAAVAQLGDAGKEAFIWWLVMDKGLGFLGLLTFFATALVLARWVIFACTFEKDLRRIRDSLGLGSCGCITPNEITGIHRKISELLKK